MILVELAPIIRVTWQRLENVTAQQLKIDGDCVHAYVTVLMCIVDAVTLVEFFWGHNCCGLCYTKSSFIKKDR